ncbi:MAG: galactose-1-phosphate uridylyltransferase [Oscillospiraceae bacterium]
MAELRWNPVLKEWVMVASHRQSRPQMPKDWCPFCPGSGHVPDNYDVYRYPNDFPALSCSPPEPDDVASDELFSLAPAYGKCEVLLYSPEHHGCVSALDDTHVHKLARLWRDVFCDMAKDENLKYSFIFENRGAAVGVTMPHPHGQAYGYPFIPKRMETELASAREYLSDHGSCIFCDLLSAERRDGRRIIFQNDCFTVYVPFFSNWTYGCNISANRHISDLSQMSETELDSLGETVREVSGMYDALFDEQFPYMMCMHNAPINSGLSDVAAACHFYIEFMTPLRSHDVQQFRASSESGAGAWCIPNRPEDKAIELSAAHAKFLSK